ncbi:hypothetical protein ASZ78_001296 [Callipepla squamata]|uniref:Uncharacterized protein n=1 Tax=Callipepla squamata TaxID=9009 RepID=A0A226MFI2_CALSU|nr:hypothetical protein ASZ78_001296 [Callipepla squamata]
MAARGEGREAPDAVHQNRLLCERVRKELRGQRLRTEHGINPLRRVHVVTPKPMSWHDNVEEPADGEVGDKHEEMTPALTLLGSGMWPQIEVDRSDRRLFFPRQRTEITEQIAAIGRLKKQQEKQSHTT